jgi:DNA recombination protein Rad52
VQTLSGKLSAKHVRTRQANGRTLSYIEGWHAIAEANRIFGFDAWDRQTMAIKCVWEGTWQGKYRCAYVARVRIKVRAGDNEICREGCGSGQGRGHSPGEAHESALKEAETDAMKRALTTFGNPFGLALYDKEQHGVRGKPRKQRKANGLILSWIVLSAEGEIVSVHEDPTDYCKAMRQILEASPTTERLTALWNRNAVTIEMLRANLPDLRTEPGEHFADVLLRLYRSQLKELHQEQEADLGTTVPAQRSQEARQEKKRVRQVAGQAGNEAVAAARPDDAGQSKVAAKGHEHRSGTLCRHDAQAEVGQSGNSVRDSGSKKPGGIDKSALAISAPRRVRDKQHLRYMASRPCLVCGRSPGHAHHLRFAQPRAMGRKVSDEWAVPLCASHHRALHTVGDEEKWWKERGIDPIAHARRLWEERRGEGVDLSSRARELIRPTPS